MDNALFSGWEPLLRTALMAGLAYPLMLLMVRISGQRTLSRMNAFDMIVTIALGSTLASVITSQDIALAQGILAFALLVALQFLIAKSSVLWPRVKNLVSSEPVLLVHEGRLLRHAMARARVTEEEVKAAARAAGHPDLREVRAVVLETNGEVSVVWREAADEQAALSAMPGAHSEDQSRRPQPSPKKDLPPAAWGSAGRGGHRPTG